MYKITAYRSVPMTPDNSDILYITSVAFLSFLDGYAAGTAKTMGNEFNPAQEIIYTGLLVDSIVPSETIENRAKKMQAVNYIKIDMYDKQGTNILKSYFYFVTNVEMMYIKNESAVSQTEIDGYFFALSIMRDVWATDFVSNEVVDEFQDPFPTISGGRMIAGHREESLFSDVSKLPAAPAIPIEPIRDTSKVQRIPLFPMSITTGQYDKSAKIVVVAMVTDPDKEVVERPQMNVYITRIHTQAIGLGNIEKSVAFLSQCKYVSEAKGLSPKKYIANILEIYVINGGMLYGYDTGETDFYTFYVKDTDPLETGAIEFEKLIDNTTGGGVSILGSLNLNDFIEGGIDNNHIYSVGTCNNRLNLLSDKSKDYKIETRIDTIGLDFKISIAIENELIDVTDDFACTMPTSETAQAMTQRLIARKVGMIQNIAGVATSAAGIIGGAKTLNPSAIFGGIGGLASGIGGIIEKAKSPKNVAISKLSDGGGLINTLPEYQGIYLEIIPAENGDDIDSNENLYGYSFEGVDYMGSITPFTEQTGINYNYLQIENISFSPPYIQYSALEWLKQRFADGVRIWYDATKYASTVRGTVPHKTE